MPCREATVEFANSGDELVFRLFRSPGMNYPEALEFKRFNVNSAGLPPLSSRDNVANYGDTLREALYRHPAVKLELQQMFGTVAPNRANLGFAIATTKGEPPFRWETLYANPTFLALNGTCSLKRVAFTAAAVTPGLRIFALPIKMAAFLSPNGLKSADQFNAIATAVRQAREQGLEIEATIFLGEQDLLDQAAADAAAGRLPGIRVQPMPPDDIAIGAVLLNDSFQILHFFGHGYARADVQMLEFASISDHDADTPPQAGSVRLPVERLTQILSSTDSVWLTVLSSCSTAEYLPGLYSMAFKLAKSGTPVTIGMADPIQSGDATRFATGFYASAFTIIATALNNLKVGQTAMIDVGPAVEAARAVLHSAAQTDAEDTFGRWCLPVLYQRDAPLMVGRAENDQMRWQIGHVAQYLRAQPPDMPFELRDQILSVLDKSPGVPPGLRPNRFGNFS